MRKWNDWRALCQTLTFTDRFWSTRQRKLSRLCLFQLLQWKLWNWGLNLLGALSSLQKLFQLQLSVFMSFDMLLQNRVMVSQAHFPVVHNVVVDNVLFFSVFFNDNPTISLHQRRPLFIYQPFHFEGLVLPIILVLSIPIDISPFLCCLDFLMLWKLRKDCFSIYRWIGHLWKVPCCLLILILRLFVKTVIFLFMLVRDSIRASHKAGEKLFGLKLSRADKIVKLRLFF